MRFPTGGTARKPRGMIRCDSGADSIVWMIKDGPSCVCLAAAFIGGFFLWGEYMTDEEYMRVALDAASYAKGRTSPNPLVGAVVVKDNRIVSVGWHRKAGTEHAEIHALKMAGDLAKGSTIYVTLEPCSHYGRTGPCAKALVEAGISRAVVAMPDPNPLVSGRGIQILKDAGIQVDVGILEEEARKLNEVFLKWIVKKIPFVTLKMAMSLDGKIATCTGESKWITSAESRLKGHEWRDSTDAILVGIGTVLADNPQLTARIGNGGHNPVRIVLDSKGRIPLESKMLHDNEASVWVAVTENAPSERIEAIKSTGAEIIVCGSGDTVNLKSLLEQIGERGITSLLVEGGGQTIYSFLHDGLADKVEAFLAPMLIGGKDAKTPVEGDGFASLEAAVKLEQMTYQMIGSDILVTGYVRK